MQLVNTMREVLTKRDWWHLPRFVYGSSRGGAMALIMAQRFPFQADLLRFTPMTVMHIASPVSRGAHCLRLPCSGHAPSFNTILGCFFAVYTASSKLRCDA